MYIVNHHLKHLFLNSRLIVSTMSSTASQTVGKTSGNMCLYCRTKPVTQWGNMSYHFTVPARFRYSFCDYSCAENSCCCGKQGSICSVTNYCCPTCGNTPDSPKENRLRLVKCDNCSGGYCFKSHLCAKMTTPSPKESDQTPSFTKAPQKSVPPPSFTKAPSKKCTICPNTVTTDDDQCSIKCYNMALASMCIVCKSKPKEPGFDCCSISCFKKL